MRNFVKNKTTALVTANPITRELELRLFKAASVYRPTSVLKMKKWERYSQLRRQIERMHELASAIGALDKAFDLRFAETHKAALRELWKTSNDCELSKRGYERKQRRGRPHVRPDIALVLYAALQKARGKRNALDDIKDLIRPGGPLQKKIDEGYGEGTYSALNIPSPSETEKRWERKCKASLKRYAEQEVLRLRPDARYEMSERQRRQVIEVTLAEGGKTRAELQEMVSILLKEQS